MKLHVHKNIEDLSYAVADWMVAYISKALENQDKFTLVLSGGSTPLRLHQILASEGYRKKIFWEKVHIFWGDERAVPFEDERNNARMAFDTLLSHVPVPDHQIHRMQTDVAPEAAAAAYEAILRGYFAGKEKTFDLVLLGMGDDGHTLSLFPGTAVIHEKQAWATSFYLEAQQMHRITLTAPIVNKSSAVAFLTTGAKKAAVLKEVLEGAKALDQYPSQIIQPAGELHWFVDLPAAANLKSRPDR